MRLSERPTGEDVAAFQRWREADARHAEAYDRIAAIWNQAGRLAGSRNAVGEGFDDRRRPTQLPGLALAAALAGAVILATLLLTSRTVPGPAIEQKLILASSTGQIRKVRLPDGSRLTLDSASKVEAVFTGSERRIVIAEGRARFEVAHEQRTFRVRAGSTDVIATGTLFDVSLVRGRTTVLLLEGSVEVRSSNGRSRLERLAAGQKLVVAPSGAPQRQRPSPGEASWPVTMLEFDETRLDEAAALANRYGETKLRLADDHVRSLRISGAFRAGDATELAQGLATAFNLDIVRQPDGSLLLIDDHRTGRSTAA